MSNIADQLVQISSPSDLSFGWLFSSPAFRFFSRFGLRRGSKSWLGELPTVVVNSDGVSERIS